MKNIDSFFSLMNYFDTVMVTDRKGIIRYYINKRNDIHTELNYKIIGRCILEIPQYQMDTSHNALDVLKSGKPVYEQKRSLCTETGQLITEVFSVLPIVQNGNIVGLIDMARYVNIENDKFFSADNIEFNKNLCSIEDILGISPQIIELKKQLRRVAEGDSYVLLCGETGTGKGLIAEAIHMSSYRVEKPFITQNCAAIPTELLEGMLFGTMKGSFTGAETKPGLLEMADGGTLLLDELNSMDITMQSKLLKVVEDKKLRRVGGTKDIPIDVRFITAINKDPVECLREGTIRPDLFYRLNVVNITIPPLRERIGDVELLTDYFIKKYNRKMHKQIVGIDEVVDKIFRTYSWPGNVRELENIIEGAFNMSEESFITRKSIPTYVLKNYEKIDAKEQICMNPDLSLRENVELVEKNWILEVLASADSISHAARILKTSKQDLSYKLKKYHIKF